MADSVSPEMKELIKNSPPAWALASHLKDAYQIPESEWEQVLKFEWTDEDETWTVRCNGSGTTKTWTGSPLSNQFPSPAAIPVPAGCHLVTVDGEAVLLAKPDGHEFFCDRGATRVWEEAAIRAMHARCLEQGSDLPPVAAFLEEKEVLD
jgi:hypothetical protein